MRFHESVGVGSSFVSTTATACNRQRFGHNQRAFNHVDEITKNFQTNGNHWGTWNPSRDLNLLFHRTILTRQKVNIFPSIPK